MKKENTEGLVDVQKLLDLMSGKKEQVKQILKLFVEHTPPFIEEIEELYKKNDLPTIKAKVHTIKSYYGYLGNLQLNQKLNDWENHLADNTFDYDHNGMLVELKTITEIIIKKLNEIFERGDLD